MSKIKNFFGGVVRFRVLCGSEALINKLRKYRVRDIKICGEYISFTAPILYAGQIRVLLRNYEYTATENSNLINGVNFLINRFVLSVAVLICCVLFFVFDFFIYSVKVTGGTQELRADIQSFLTENGIKKFSLKQRLADGNVADSIVNNYPTVAHANIRIYGNTAVITVAEAESNPVKPPVNLFAQFDAVIKEIYVGSGSAKVTVGDVVKKGDLLVENGYADKVLIMGEVLFETKESFVVLDLNIV
jgi:hypothetical protein